MKMGAVDWGAARRRSAVVFSLGRRPRHETGPGHPSDPATVTTARAGSTQGNVTTRPVSAAAGPSGVATMDVLYPCCAGLDVHKDSVYACVRRVGPGRGVRQPGRAIGTITPAVPPLGDVLGKSGRAMLRALIAGETDPEKLAALALGRLRKQLPRLRPALTGRVTEHHRFVLKLLLDEVEMIEGLVIRLEERIGAVLGPFAEAVRRWMTIPGVDVRTAQAVAAEIGTDMSRFPSECHLAAWAGMGPGNDESAGKRRSGTTPKGSP